MGLRLVRCLGPVSALQPAEWTDRTASGLVVIACPACGDVSELDDEHQPTASGVVPMAWSCPNPGCPFLEYLSCDSYNEGPS